MSGARTRGRVGLGSASERGAASVLAVGIVGATLSLVAVVVPLGGFSVASQRATGAADSAALAAADARSGAVAGVPCELAARVAARNGAALAGCEVDDAVASVTVVVSALAGELRARARAGPAGWDP